ncbi:MAG: hypothetical protein LBE34_04080 [Flavobacteriaceae bacterium]|jgi:hypothetical protein|nr:hypothetical protein [Flavobacteriaceae bacterium]
MKKALLITFCVVFSILILSCQKEDSSGLEAVKKTLQLTASSNEVERDSEITFTVTADGTPIKDAEIVIVNIGQLKEYKWIPKKEDTYRFYATKTGFNNSEQIIVKVVTPIIVDKSEVYINYLNQKINLENPIMQMNAFSRSKTTKQEEIFSRWTFEAENLKLGLKVLIYFNTPSIDIGNNKYNYVLPNKTNITDVNLLLLKKNDKGIFVQENIAIAYNTASFTLFEAPKNDIIKGEFNVINPAIANVPFELKCKGDISFKDNSE